MEIDSDKRLKIIKLVIRRVKITNTEIESVRYMKNIIRRRSSTKYIKSTNYYSTKLSIPVVSMLQL
jgi:hypothetical protein